MSQRDPSSETNLERIGPYRLEARLAKGGMGEIYRGHDERLDRPVALKRILAANAGSERIRERFRREAKLVARLSHPSIVQVFDWLEEQGENWLVMELVHGVSLREVASEGTLSMRQLVGCSLGIARGLEAAHREGIIHRDLKLSNVMLTEDGVKILDFGIAKSLRRTGHDDMVTLTEEGVVMGSLSSMSPEQALGQRVDHRSDLFSLGSVIYELLTGKAPFKAKNASETLIRIYSWEHLPIEESNPEVPRRLCRLVDRLLEKEPANRPVDASEVVLELEDVAGELGGLSSRIFKAQDPSTHSADEPTRGLATTSPEMAALEATLPNGLAAESTPVDVRPASGEVSRGEAPPVLRRPRLGWIVAAALLLALGGLVLVPRFSATRPAAEQVAGPAAPQPAEAAASGAEASGGAEEVEAPAIAGAGRLAVLPFENRTGEPALDAFGLIIADWLTRRFAERIDVVPLESAFGALLTAEAEGGLVEAGGLADELEAELVVSGAYYRSNKELIVRAQIQRAGEKKVASSETIRVPEDDAIAGLALLERELVAAVASSFDLPMTPGPGTPGVSTPGEDFASYEDYAAHVEDLRRSWQSSGDAGEADNL